jgi:hypothetical protein
MKDMTREEFNERIAAVAEAQRIFIVSGITNSIDVAWEIYLDVLSEKEFEKRITSDAGKRFSDNPLDQVTRPKCPVCSNDLYFRRVPPNHDGIKTQLVCASDTCDTILNSDKTLDEWLEALRNENQ